MSESEADGLAYRFFVTFFPILPGYLPETMRQRQLLQEERERTVNPFWTWVIRGYSCRPRFTG